MSATKKMHDPLESTFDPLLHNNTKVDLFGDNIEKSSKNITNEPIETAASKLAASLLSSNASKKIELFKEETNIFGDDDDILFKQIKKNREEKDALIRQKEQEYGIIFKIPFLLFIL